MEFIESGKSRIFFLIFMYVVSSWWCGVELIYFVDMWKVMKWDVYKKLIIFLKWEIMFEELEYDWFFGD